MPAKRSNVRLHRTPGPSKLRRHSQSYVRSPYPYSPAARPSSTAIRNSVTSTPSSPSLARSKISPSSLWKKLVRMRYFKKDKSTCKSKCSKRKKSDHKQGHVMVIGCPTDVVKNRFPNPTEADLVDASTQNTEEKWPVFHARMSQGGTPASDPNLQKALENREPEYRQTPSRLQMAVRPRPHPQLKVMRPRSPTTHSSNPHSRLTADQVALKGITEEGPGRSTQTGCRGPLSSHPVTPEEVDALPHAPQPPSRRAPAPPDLELEIPNAAAHGQRSDRAPKLNVVIGQQDPSSPYFTSRFFRIRDYGSSSDTAGTSSSSSATLSYEEAQAAVTHSNEELSQVPMLCPHAFELYTRYRESKKAGRPRINFSMSQTSPGARNYTWQQHWPLFNAYIHGTTIKDADFADRVIDLLATSLVRGVCADFDTITHVFTANGISEQLKQFVVDRCIGAGAQHFRRETSENLPQEYVLLALEAATERLDYGGRLRAQNPGCEYHIHARPEECYKWEEARAAAEAASRKEAKRMEKEICARRRKRKEEETQKEKLQEMARRKTLESKVTESNQVEAVGTPKQDNQKDTYWADRRDEAARRLSERNGKTWVGFKRLENPTKSGESRAQDGAYLRQGPLRHVSEHKKEGKTVHELRGEEAKVVITGDTSSGTGVQEEQVITNGETDHIAGDSHDGGQTNGDTSHPIRDLQDQVVTIEEITGRSEDRVNQPAPISTADQTSASRTEEPQERWFRLDGTQTAATKEHQTSYPEPVRAAINHTPPVSLSNLTRNVSGASVSRVQCPGAYPESAVGA